MFKVMRREDRRISDGEALALLENGFHGVLSTVNNGGYPYGVPLSYVYLDKAVYFHSARDGHKLDNISQNSWVSFCVVGKTAPLLDKPSIKYVSVILFGRAVEVEGVEKDRVLQALVKKYIPRYTKGEQDIAAMRDKTRVFKINVEYFTGKANN